MITLFFALATITVLEELNKAGDVEFSSCAEAIAAAEEAQEPTLVECRYIAQYEPEEPPPPPPPPPPPSSWSLDDFGPKRTVTLPNRDASGITFLADGTLLITFQSSFGFYNLAGTRLGQAAGIAGDVEGLDFGAAGPIALNEPGQVANLQVVGQTINVLNVSSLPQGGLECVAFDPSTGETYYGQEASGVVFDSGFTPRVDLGRDLAGCTVYDGYLLAILSHAWRESTWVKVDLNTFSVVEQQPLPTGDWEGISCRGSTCVLVQETSVAAPASFVVYER